MAFGGLWGLCLNLDGIPLDGGKPISYKRRRLVLLDLLVLEVAQPKPVMNKPPPLNRDYNRDPNIKALKKRGFINHGSSPKPLNPKQ